MSNNVEMQVAIQLLHASAIAYTHRHAYPNINSPKTNLYIGIEMFYTKHAKPSTLKILNQ